MYIFNSKIEDSERLEKMLIGRKDLVDLLEQKALNLITKRKLFQSLIIGPRGSGKTHVLTVLYNRLTSIKKIEEKIVIAYMAEDEYGIDTFLDLIIRIFNAIIRWYDCDPAIEHLSNEIEDLKLIPPDEQEARAVKILDKYLDKRELLIIMENLNDVFKGLKVAGQGKLRDYIQQNGNISIVASSQSLFLDIQKEDKPFQNFFNITHLDPLTFEDSYDLVKTLAEDEGIEELVKLLNSSRGKANVNAIYDLTKGNHRLLVTFYDFLKAELKSDMAEAFLHTIDKLKPYYESYLQLIPPQQQKIVQYLSMQRKAVTGKEISLNCFISQNTLSKQLSALNNLGYLANHRVGKDAYYEIAEPMLRLAFEINENKKGIVKLFVDFLTNLYEVSELSKKYLHYKYLAKFQPLKSKQLFEKEALLFKEALQTFPNVDIGAYEYKIEQLQTKEDRAKYINELSIESDKDNLLNKAIELYFDGKYIQALKQIDQVLIKDFKNEAAHVLKVQWLYQKNHKVPVDAVKKALKYFPKNFILLGIMGTQYGIDKNYEQSIVLIEKALKIENDSSSLWIILGKSSWAINKYSEAEKAFSRALEISPKDPVIWNSLVQVILMQEKFHEAELVILKGIKQSSKKEGLCGLLSGLYVVQEEWTKFQATFSKYLLSANKEKVEVPQFIGIYLEHLFGSASFRMVSKLIPFMVKELEANGYKEAFRIMFSASVFSLLSNYKKIEESRLTGLREHIKKLDLDPEMVSNWDRYMDIGIRHFYKNDKRALFELAKEERDMFNKFTKEFSEK